MRWIFTIIFSMSKIMTGAIAFKYYSTDNRKAVFICLLFIAKQGFEISD